MNGQMDGWTDGCMDAWMHGCMNARMNGFTDARMHGCTDARMHGRMDAWMDGWMDGWMHACMHAWMDGWMDGWMDARGRKCLVAGFFACLFLVNVACWFCKWHFKCKSLHRSQRHCESDSETLTSPWDTVWPWRCGAAETQRHKEREFLTCAESRSRLPV